jgi:hypothetical protein
MSAITERLRDELASLLDQPESKPKPGDETSRDELRARLSADVAEGVARSVRRNGVAASDDLAALAAYLDDGLPAVEREAMAARLAADPAARSEAAAMADLLGDMDAAPAALPPHLAARAAALLAPERHRPVRASAGAGLLHLATGRWRPMTHFGLAAFAACALAAVIVTPLLWTDAGDMLTQPPQKGMPIGGGMTATPSVGNAAASKPATAKVPEAGKSPETAKVSETGKSPDAADCDTRTDIAQQQPGAAQQPRNGLGRSISAAESTAMPPVAVRCPPKPAAKSDKPDAGR